MDSRTRVESALALQIADRPPVAWWGHTFEEEWSPGHLAQVTIDRARRYGWDFVKFQPRASSFAETFGAKYAPSGNAGQPPVADGQVVNDAEGWANLEVVNPAALQDQVKGIKLVTEALGPSVPVLQTVFSPLTVAGYLVGADKQRAVQELRKDPGLVGKALGKIAQVLAQFAAASINAGAAGVFYAISGYAGSDLMTEQEYEKLALQHDQPLLKSLPDTAWFNVLHLCGPGIHFGLSQTLPVHAVSWSIHDTGNPSLAEGRDRSGKAVMGGLGRHDTLVKGSAETVAAEGSKAIQETGGRGLLLAPGCSVPVEAPEENLSAITDVFSRV